MWAPAARSRSPRAPRWATSSRWARCRSSTTTSRSSSERRSSSGSARSATARSRARTCGLWSLRGHHRRRRRAPTVSVTAAAGRRGRRPGVRGDPVPCGPTPRSPRRSRSHDGTATADDDYLEPAAGAAHCAVRSGPDHSADTRRHRARRHPRRRRDAHAGTPGANRSKRAGGQATATRHDQRPHCVGRVVVTPQQLTVTEGGTATLRVRLGVDPGARGARQSADECRRLGQAGRSRRFLRSSTPRRGRTP